MTLQSNDIFVCLFFILLLLFYYFFFFCFTILYWFRHTSTWIHHSQLMRHPLVELFHLTNLLQMLNDCRMVDAEFFGNFPVVVRGSASMVALRWLLSTSLCSSSSRVSSPLQNFFNYHCTVRSLAVPGPNALSPLLCNPFWTQENC